MTSANPATVPVNANTQINFGIVPAPTASPTPTPTYTPTPTLTAIPTPSPTPVPVYTLSGTVFTDSNSNGVQDSGETGYQGATVTLSGTGTAATTTDASGAYAFSNFTAGSYTVTLTTPGGYSTTTTDPVTVPLSVNTQINFGIVLSPTSSPTPTPTITPSPTPTTPPAPHTSQASSGGSKSSNSASNNHSSSGTSHGCSDPAPNGAPHLFQINTTSTTATLYFAPAGSPYSSFYVAFGNGAADEGYGGGFNHGYSQGALSYTVYLLSPGTTYTFKVRAGNGCTAGRWSADMSVKTLGRYSRGTVMYYPTRQAAVVSSASFFSTFSAKVGGFIQNIFTPRHSVAIQSPPPYQPAQPVQPAPIRAVQSSNQGNSQPNVPPTTHAAAPQPALNTQLKQPSFWGNISNFFSGLLHLF